MALTLYCIGRKKEVEVLEKFLEVNILKRAVLVQGPSMSGKTEFVLSFLKENKYRTAYYDYAVDKYNSYAAITQNISLYETEYLAEIDKDFLPYKNMHPQAILDHSALGTKQAIVIDNFSGDETELMKFCSLVEKNDILLFLISSKLYSEGIAISIRMKPLEADEIEQIFYELNDKQKMTENEQQCISMIRERIFDQAWLMRFIAKWYKHVNAKKRKSEIELLQELVNAMDSNTFTKLNGDVKFRLHTSEPDAKLINHIYSVAGKYLGKKEKYTYLLLSCLGGHSFPKEYLTKWLEIEAETIDELCDGGWCIEEAGGNLMKIKIPKIVAASYCRKGERKDAIELQVMMRFIERFSREIRYEEYGVIDIRYINNMIEYVHDFCIESVDFVKNKTDVFMIRKFHLDCIRYYLLLCDAKPARELFDNWMDKLKLNENELEIQILKLHEQMLIEETGDENGIRDTLLKLEELYFKPLWDNSQEISFEKAEELCECLKLILDVLWTNLERIILFQREYYRPIIIEEIDTFTSCMERILIEWEGRGTWLFTSTIARYRVQLEMLKKMYGFYGNVVINVQLTALSRMFDASVQRKNLCRLEQIEKLRFFLDFQFLLMEYLSRIPIGMEKMRIECAMQDLWKQCCKSRDEYGKMFPLDVVIKFRMIEEIFEGIFWVN